MPTATAPLLAQYTYPPESRSLYLITSLLGTTSNWLVLRYLCDALYPHLSPARGRWPPDAGVGVGIDIERPTVGQQRGTMKVVLVSFTRGWEFWRVEAKRLGIDLTRLAAEHKFVFMDGLTELFSHESSQAPAPTVLLGGRSPASHASHFIPTAKRQPPTSHHAAPVRQHGYQKPSGTTRLRWSKTGRLEAIERDVVSAIDSLDSTSSDENRVPATDNVLLVIDQPDLLLAATGSSLGIGAQEIRDMIMNLRQHVHSTLITLSADSPLMHYEESGNPLEVEHTSLVVGMAYQARIVMQLRGLETGVARDVSGVLQINRGTSFKNSAGLKGSGQEDSLEPKEVLYYVQADGAVRVFGRGE